LLPPIQETEIVLSPNPNEIAITPTQNTGLVRQNSYNGQDGGKKRNNKKSKTIRLGGRRKSKKSILIKKHLNKRASKYTNARTKKSNSK
jgi:hypothetical protein